MKLVRVVSLMAVIPVFFAYASAQEKMSKQEWEHEINQYTQLRNEENTKLADLTKQLSSLQTQSSQLDRDIVTCQGELYAMVGSDAQKAAAYRKQIESAEQKAEELLRLSDAELAARKNDVKGLGETAKVLRANKLSLIPEFSDRLDALDQKVAQLEKSISTIAEQTYTVRTWSEYKDCLWNIAKNNDVYNNAWLWPKIWQGNTDKIKNPDLIFPGEKLRVPAGTSLTADEKAAANRYYANEHHEGKKIERKPVTSEHKTTTKSTTASSS